MNKRQAILVTFIIVLVLIIDQVIKVEVKTNMTLGEHIPVTSWFHIAFVENNGMAFGITLGSKILLTLFRIAAISMIVWYVYRLTSRHMKTGFMICLALIAAGAIGNVIDCLFYGEIFTESTHFAVAHFVPWGEGYSNFLTGKVVDMFYFPLIEWNIPGWLWLNDIPFLPDAYEHCVFFSPVFNFADACISCGVIALILFYHKSLSRYLKIMVEDDKDKEENKKGKHQEKKN